MAKNKKRVEKMKKMYQMFVKMERVKNGEDDVSEAGPDGVNESSSLPDD